MRGDATKSDVLRLAGAQHAAAIIVATNRDDTAVLVTLTAREFAPNAKIVASIREAENQHLLQQSGADSVVVSSETAGRLLGIATTTPSVVEMIEDLLTPDAGFAIAEREVERKEVGGSPRHLPDIVLGVVRDGKLLRVDEPEVDALEAGDRLLYIRSAGEVRADDVDFQLAKAFRCCRASAPTAPTSCAPTSMRPIAGWAEAAVLRVDQRNQVLIADGRVVLGNAPALSATSRQRTRCSSAASRTAGTCGRSGRRWSPRRSVQMPRCSICAGPEQFSTTSARSWCRSATALLNWHDNARFSCGRRLAHQAGQGGWARVNPVTGHEEFPRIDPAVICLVHDGGDRVVLARQTVWPERMFSLLAGFVEAGESFETCVVREIGEEIGLAVRDVRYLGSQPWPFPRSLMVGFHALGRSRCRTSRSTTARSPRRHWFTRDEVRDALALGDWSSAAASQSKLLLPGLDFDRPGDHRVLGRAGQSGRAGRQAQPGD